MHIVVYKSYGQEVSLINNYWRRNELESGHFPAEPEKNWDVPLHFLAPKVQFIVLVSAFVAVSTIWSFYCLLFSTHGAPRSQPFEKVGGHAQCPMECHCQQLTSFKQDWRRSVIIFLRTL